MRDCMGRASRLVLEGVEVAVKAKIVAWPDRFMDDRPEAEDMWRDAMGHLVAIEREARVIPQMMTPGPADDDPPQSVKYDHPSRRVMTRWQYFIMFLLLCPS